MPARANRFQSIMLFVRANVGLDIGCKVDDVEIDDGPLRVIRAFLIDTYGRASCAILPVLIKPLLSGLSTDPCDHAATWPRRLLIQMLLHDESSILASMSCILHWCMVGCRFGDCSSEMRMLDKLAMGRRWDRLVSMPFECVYI